MKKAVLLSCMTMMTFAFAAGPASAQRASSQPPNTLSAKEKKQGWKLLFDGKTLKGWRVYGRKGTKGWEVKDGAMFLKGRGGDLMTVDKFGDFEFMIDWKFVKGNNSGIIYRVKEVAGKPSYITGPEMQVMSQSPKQKLGKNSGGSLYDMYAPSTNAFKGEDGWTTYKVVCRGNHIEQWVNGVKVVDCEIGSKEWNERYAKSKWKNNKLFASQPNGHIALQDHGGSILFRNAKVRQLD